MKPSAIPESAVPKTVTSNGSGHSKQALLGLTIAALGVVYGDIGTSPLYSTRVSFTPVCGVPPTESNILGIISMILWSLFSLIAIKYLALVLRADNRGEGGILALMALVNQNRKAGKRTLLFVLLGLFGASLLYGDGLITPAISVLSAMEGLNMGIIPFSNHTIIVLSLIVLVALFWMQRRGTQTVGAIFGPVMLIWFTTIAILGIISIFKAPGILAALNPWHAAEFLINNRWQAFVTMGAVFLAVTGGEALYADMGHFGIGPIRLGWFTLVMPALVLNYCGQGAWMLHQLTDPQSVSLINGQITLNQTLIANLFYRNVPHWAIYPMVALATAATIIASQAIISGAFSMTRQAIQLGYCPRLAIIHTSKRQIGQVYLPLVNGLMLLGTVLLVLGFKNSDSLAGAYGVAVSLTMLITTLFMIAVMRRLWHWPRTVVILIAVPFLLMDLTFFGSNILKIADGGWVPLAISIGFIIMMTTWNRGREILGRQMAEAAISIDLFINDVATSQPHRVSGVAVFLTGNPNGIPRTLLHNYKHNKILHKQIVFITIQTEDIPHVPDDERTQVKVLPEGFYQLLIRYGFSEDPDLSTLLKNLKIEGLDLDPMRVTFFLGRETLILVDNKNMRPWRKILFSYLSRNAWDASKFFRIPPNRVIEIGIQVEL
ncbi:MAG: potassium transporter Kup [bacterium]